MKAPARAIYKRANRVVCIGRDLEREACVRACRATGSNTCPTASTSRDFVRPNLASMIGCAPSSAGLRRPIVLFVGRLSIEKGVMDLVDAWRQTDRKNAMLVLVGPDMTGHPWDAGGPARAFVAAHGLGGSVRFDGYAADPSRFYRAADVFVQPSHFEALGNTAIEAMASGLPVISSGVGGLADFCVDGENALVHEPHSPPSLASAIGRLLADRELANRLAAAGRRTAEERFELDGLLDRYAQLIETVVSDRR